MTAAALGTAIVNFLFHSVKSFGNECCTVF